MVRREENLNPNVAYGPCMHACAPPRPSLCAVLKLSKITHDWWLSEQLPGAREALRPRPPDRPSTHASRHPSIFTEGCCDRASLRSANYAGSGVAEVVLSADEHHKCLQSLLTRGNFVVPQLVISQTWFETCVMNLDWTCPEQQRWLLQQRSVLNFYLHWLVIVANCLDDDEEEDVKQSLGFVNPN